MAEEVEKVVSTPSSSPAAAPPTRDRRLEITLALIGTFGILATGLLSNYDKIFGHSITASYSRDYHANGDFDTEVRYFMDHSGGLRDMFKQMREVEANGFKSELLSRGVADDAQLAKAVDVFTSAMTPYSEIEDKLISIYKKYYTLAEIRDLNKLASTPQMQEMREKSHLMDKEVMEYAFVLRGADDSKTKDAVARSGIKLKRQTPHQ